MENLIKPAQYAKDYGISRQAVYAKIKKGILASKEVDGQIYVDLSSEQAILNENAANTLRQPQTNNVLHTSLHAEYRTVLASKNETIETLKSRIEDLKESNEQMTSVLKGEIDLLKQAFNEMKLVYSNQLLGSSLNMPEVLPQTVQNVEYAQIQEENRQWVTLEEYLDNFSINPKYHVAIMDYVDTVYEMGDSRVMLIEGALRVDSKVVDLDFAREALK